MPGTYSVAETVPDRLGPRSRDLQRRPPGRARSTLGPGETVTCTFTNEKDAKIVVVKETDPDGDPQVFDVHGRLRRGGFQSLRRPVEQLAATSTRGTYSVAETVPAGWDLDQRHLQRRQQPGLDRHCTAGETVTCTFTNQKDAEHRRRQADAIPPDEPEVFAFDSSYPPDGFNLSDGQSNNSGDLAPGTYSVAETVPAGWDLGSVVCDDGSEPDSIGLTAGETVTCTFVNQKDANIVVWKQTEPDADGTSFEFSASFAPLAFSLTDGTSLDSGDLDPGSYRSARSFPRSGTSST